MATTANNANGALGLPLPTTITVRQKPTKIAPQR